MESWSIATRQSGALVRLDTYLGNVGQNDSTKIYRAKTPRTQRKKYFSELGALCVFARGILFRFRNQNSSDNFKYLWLAFQFETLFGHLADLLADGERSGGAG
jgi:hypothetical protein